MAPFKDKHHPSTLSDVGTNPVGPAGVVLEERRAMRHFHALTRDRWRFRLIPDGQSDAMPDAVPVEAGRRSDAKPDTIPI